MMALMVDDLNLLVWRESKQGRKNRNRPKSIYKLITQGNEPKKNDIQGFDSPADFEKALAQARASKEKS